MLGRVSSQGYTALLIVCQGRNLDLATFLVSKGADLNAVTERGISPVHLAAEAGETDLTRMLLAAGVSGDFSGELF